MVEKILEEEYDALLIDIWKIMIKIRNCHI